LVETTVPPGTSGKIVKPLLIDCLKKRGLPPDEIKVGHSYERVMPGPKYIDSIQNFYRVFAGTDERSADAVEKFLRTVIKTDEYPLTKLGNTNATEMARFGKFFPCYEHCLHCGMEPICRRSRR